MVLSYHQFKLKLDHGRSATTSVYTENNSHSNCLYDWREINPRACHLFERDGSEIFTDSHASWTSSVAFRQRYSAGARAFCAIAEKRGVRTLVFLWSFETTSTLSKPPSLSLSRFLFTAVRTGFLQTWKLINQKTDTPQSCAVAILPRQYPSPHQRTNVYQTHS